MKLRRPTLLQIEAGLVGLLIGLGMLLNLASSWAWILRLLN